MVKCDYCDKAIERLVFCSPSHKVLYHRKGKPGIPHVIKEISLPKVNKSLPKVNSDLPKVNANIKYDKNDLCPHFVKRGGYCRMCNI